jgi:putative tricarboxylic transport membrane protein
MSAPPGGRRGAVAFALALLAVVGIAAWQVVLIPVPPSFTAVGPTVMPAAVVAVLALLALAYLVQGLRGRSPDKLHDETEGPLPGRLRRAGWLTLGLLSILLLTPYAGIGAAGVAAFVLVARAFDSNRWLRDLLIAIATSFSLWYLFDRLLGVKLGPFFTLIG